MRSRVKNTPLTENSALKSDITHHVRFCLRFKLPNYQVLLTRNFENTVAARLQTESDMTDFDKLMAAKAKQAQARSEIVKALRSGAMDEIPALLRADEIATNELAAVINDRNNEQ